MFQSWAFSTADAMIAPAVISVVYHAPGDSYLITTQVTGGLFSVIGSTPNGDKMGQACFGLSENGEQPMIGTNINPEGFINSNKYLLASTDLYGLAKVDGTTVVSNNGVLSANVQEYVLPAATETVLGGVKVSSYDTASGFMGF